MRRPGWTVPRSAFMPAIHVDILAGSNADCRQALNLVDNIIQYGAFKSLWPRYTFSIPPKGMAPFSVFEDSRLWSNESWIKLLCDCTLCYWNVTALWSPQIVVLR